MLLRILSLLSKSLRKKSWFKALNAYNNLINLVLRNVKMVRNKQLAIVLARMVAKLTNVDPIKIKVFRCVK
ncbi:MAG: hypothetical protein QXK74_08555 [Candidatus Nitrosocaldaceae archaeon]